MKGRVHLSGAEDFAAELPFLLLLRTLPLPLAGASCLNLAHTSTLRLTRVHAESA